ncbi:MAG: N-acetylglucosamine-6-phosphate deacetylase [Pseudomonadota bacterium]
MPRSFVIGDRVLTADGWVDGQGIEINGGLIDAVRPPPNDPSDNVHNYPGCMIVPGFIDVQVNGGGGVQFNATITPDAIQEIGAAHARFGTTSFLPTLISDTPNAFDSALRATADAIDARSPGVLGLHLEGPFLNTVKRGVHDASHFRQLDDGVVKQLASWGHGPLVLTVAPEVVGAPMIKQLSDAGVLLCAGHTAASYDETREALDNGLRGFTHLYNAMPPLVSREPGPVAAALESNAWCGIIADGHHVAPSMLNLAIRAKADGRIMLVSDAMAVAASSVTTFNLGGTKINVENGKCVDEHGTLAGSSITMLDAVRYCVRTLGISLEDALRMASTEPAAFLRKSDEVGMLMPGYRANLAVISPELEVIASFIDGLQVYQKG